MSLFQLSDDDLIAGFQQATGQNARVQFFEVLWLRSEQKVSDMVERSLRRRHCPWSGDDVLDIRVRVLSKVWSSLGRYRGTGRWDNWLRTIVATSTVDWIRKETGERHLFGLFLTPEDEKALNQGTVPDVVLSEFSARGSPSTAQLLRNAAVDKHGDHWVIATEARTYVARKEANRLEVYRRRTIENPATGYGRPDEEESQTEILDRLSVKGSECQDDELIKLLRAEIEGEQESRIQKALDVMARMGDREALWAKTVYWHFMKGLKKSELATSFRASGRTINKRLDCGLRLLKDILEEHFGIMDSYDL